MTKDGDEVHRRQPADATGSTPEGAPGSRVRAPCGNTDGPWLLLVNASGASSPAEGAVIETTKRGLRATPAPGAASLTIGLTAAG